MHHMIQRFAFKLGKRATRSPPIGSCILRTLRMQKQTAPEMALGSVSMQSRPGNNPDGARGTPYLMPSWKSSSRRLPKHVSSVQRQRLTSYFRNHGWHPIRRRLAARCAPCSAHDSRKQHAVNKRTQMFDRRADNRCDTLCVLPGRILHQVAHLSF